jgi:hypothetical protein
MLIGTADVETLGRSAPNVRLQYGPDLNLGDVDWLQFTYEMPGDRQNLFPAGLHPTMPPIVTLQLWRSSGGDLGRFGMAQLRLSCRAGMRIRAFLVESVIDGEVAAKTLSERFGYRATPGEVTVKRRADRIEGGVRADGRTVLEATMLKPQSLEADALQHIGNMNLGRLPEGLRLLQVEPEVTTLGLQRGEQRIVAFDSTFWGLEGRKLRYPVAAAAAHTRITLPPVRYVQDPGLEASHGTVVVSNKEA